MTSNRGENNGLQAQLIKLQRSKQEVDNRPYIDILLDKLTTEAANYDWQISSEESGEIVLQHKSYTIKFALDPLDDSFAGGVLSIDLRHDLDVFEAMRTYGRPVVQE